MRFSHVSKWRALRILWIQAKHVILGGSIQIHVRVHKATGQTTINSMVYEVEGENTRVLIVVEDKESLLDCLPKTVGRRQSLG